MRRRMSTFGGVVSTGRRNTGGQLAINNDDGLPNAHQIAFGDFPRNPQHYFLCRPHTTTKSLTYRPTLSIFFLYDKVLRRSVEPAAQSGLSETDLTVMRLAAPVANRRVTAKPHWRGQLR